jgi:hypothetical protein
MRFLAMAAVIWGVASCSSMPPPIPVAGGREALSELAGQWSGDYFSTQTGRHGSIIFELAAESDTAFGDVLMIPRREMQPVSTHPASQAPAYTPPSAIRIAFVRAEGDSVVGLLDPYDDPECGCTLFTRFAGRMRADEIVGTYSTRNQKSGEITTGEWRVRRRR